MENTALNWQPPEPWAPPPRASVGIVVARALGAVAAGPVTLLVVLKTASTGPLALFFGIVAAVAIGAALGSTHSPGTRGVASIAYAGMAMIVAALLVAAVVVIALSLLSGTGC